MAASKSSGSNATYARDPLVGVDLGDAEDFGVECLGPLVSARVARTNKDEALPTDRKDV